MRFYIKATLMRMKLSLDIFFIASCILYIAIMVISIWSYKEDGGSSVDIGFVYDENEYTKKILEQYEYYSKDFYNVKKYEDEERLKNDVKKNRVDIGYVLGNRGEEVKLYKSNKSITMSMNNMLLGSIFEQENAGLIGYEILKPYVIEEDEERIKNRINEINAKYLEEAPFLEIKNINYGNNMEENTNTNSEISLIKTLYSVIGLFMMIFGLLFYNNEKNENTEYVYKKLNEIKKDGVYYLANSSAYVIILFIFGIMSVVVVNKQLLESGVLTIGMIAGILLYSMLISCLIFFLLTLKKYVSSSVILIYYVSALIFGNMFIELEKFIVQLRNIKYLYGTYYFSEAMLGNKKIIIGLVVVVTILNIVNVIILKGRGRKK